MNKREFKGTWRLVSLLYRQHRFKILLWLFGIIGISLTTALVYPEIYLTQEDILGFAMTVENPAMRALLGANYAVSDFNVGAIYASEMLMFTSIAVAIMNILIMKTSTREAEEEGRLEIIQSLPVGNLASIVASLALLFFVNLAIILLLTLGLTILGTDVFTIESSLLYSTILGVTGFLFAAFTAVAAQLSKIAYGTTIFSFGFLMLSYGIRIIGDIQNETLSLFSPLGWVTQSEVFVNNNWLPIMVLAISSLVLVIVAFYLRAKRDMFAGILPSRSGKARASSFLKTTPGFIWTMQKGKVIVFFLLIFTLSATFGAILGEMETYFSDMEIIQVFLDDRSGSTMTEQFISFLIELMTIFSIVPGVMILHSLKKEELAGRMEHFYTRAVSRTKIFVSYFSYALGTVLLMQLGLAFGIFSTSVMMLENPIALRSLIEATLVYLPTILFVLGVATLFVGALPKYTLITWFYTLFLFLILYLSDLLDFPQWLNDFSALYLVPNYPYEPLNWNIMGLLSGIGIIFTVLGLIGYKKRDIQSS